MFSPVDIGIIIENDILEGSVVISVVKDIDGVIGLIVMGDILDQVRTVYVAVLISVVPVSAVEVNAVRLIVEVAIGIPAAEIVEFLVVIVDLVDVMFKDQFSEVCGVCVV